MADDDDDEYEKARQERLRQNAAKLRELQVKAAARDVRKGAQAQREAERQRALAQPTAGAGPHRRSGRAAAARTTAKLQQQVGSGTDTDSVASSDEEHDPLDDACGSDSEQRSTSVVDSEGGSDASGAWGRSKPAARATPNARGHRHPQAASPAAADAAGGAGPSAGDVYVMDLDQEQLQQALALSMADAGRASAGPAPGGSAQASPKAPAAAPRPAAAVGQRPKAKWQQAPVKGQPKETAKRKRQDVGPPSDEDVDKAFQLLNPQRLSAIIASDIDEVASNTLGVDLEPTVLHNMMKRACDMLQLQHPRLTLDDFRRLTRHYCC